MELKQLQFFVVSVDMGSFKKAAEVLYTTQPHVSKTIKALETELNVELFNRNASGVAVTEAGKQIYAYASSILKKIDVIEQVGENEKQRKLCISAMHNSKIEGMFAEFYQANREKNIQFQYMEGTVEDIMGHLHHRISDIGFVFISERQLAGFIHELEHKRLEFVPLKKIEPCLAVGKKSPLYGAESVEPSVLSTVRLVRTEGEFYSISTHPGHLKGSFPNNNSEQKAVATNSEGLVMSLLDKTDLGIVCGNFLPGEFERCELHFIPLTKLQDSIDFGYVKRMRDELNPLAQSWVAYVKEMIGKSESINLQCKY